MINHLNQHHPIWDNAAESSFCLCLDFFFVSSLLSLHSNFIVVHYVIITATIAAAATAMHMYDTIYLKHKSSMFHVITHTYHWNEFAGLMAEQKHYYFQCFRWKFFFLANIFCTNKLFCRVNSLIDTTFYFIFFNISLQQLKEREASMVQRIWKSHQVHHFRDFVGWSQKSIYTFANSARHLCMKYDGLWMNLLNLNVMQTYIRHGSRPLPHHHKMYLIFLWCDVVESPHDLKSSKPSIHIHPTSDDTLFDY